MQDCTHLSRFALVSRVFPGRYAKKYTGYCIIACVPMCLSTTKRCPDKGITTKRCPRIIRAVFLSGQRFKIIHHEFLKALLRLGHRRVPVAAESDHAAGIGELPDHIVLGGRQQPGVVPGKYRTAQPL